MINILYSIKTLVHFKVVNRFKLFQFLYFVAFFSHFDIKIEENKTYSWDLKRQNMDTSKFIIEDIQNTEVGRVPGEINGIYEYILRKVLTKNTNCRSLKKI